MKIRIIVIICCLMLMITVVSIVESLNHNYKDQPQKADVIIMLGGDNGRIQKTAELYHEGYAPYVIITPVLETEWSSQSIQMAESLGIPVEAIIPEYVATSTYTNATISIEMMKEHGFKSALIVTSDYHIKRSQYIFEKENDANFDFKYIPSYTIEGERWYETSQAFYLWRSELIKLWGYRFSLYNFIDTPDYNEIEND